MQNYDTSGEPRQIWDGRGILTEAVTTGYDDSGEPGEIHRIDGSLDYYDRVNPGVSGSAPIDPAQGMHNPYNHWLFSETHQIDAATSHTTYYTRDSRRRVTRIDYPGSYEEFVYNNFNQVISHRLPSGTTVYSEYDSRGLLQQEWNDVDGQSDATIYHYDAFDRVETVSHAWSRAKGAQFSAKMTYNGRHQVTSVESPDAPQSDCQIVPPPPAPIVADPTINPATGNQPSTPPVNVTITTATAGANIRYTLDGTNPSESSGTLIAASSGSVAVSSTAQGTVLKVVAFKSGWTTSAVKSATYTKPQVVDPVISPDGGTYPSTPPAIVSITTTTAGANIRYTLDGSIPSESNGTLISASSGTVAVSSTAQGAVLKAIAFETGWTSSAVKSSAPYTMPQVSDPIFSPDGGTYFLDQPPTVTITTATAGANIRYTLDGTNPSDSNGTLIAASSGTVVITQGAQGAVVLKAVTLKTGWKTSPVKSSAPYVPHAAAPVFDPEGRTFDTAGPITVTVTTSAPGANIRYTLDNTQPTESYGTLIPASSGTVSVTPQPYGGTTLKAIAFGAGWSASGVHSGTYYLPNPCDGCPSGGGGD